MILYVNGDSHTAAAEAVNAYAFAEDDPRLHYLKRLPHPDNIRVSWGHVLANNLKAVFRCDAESAASNDRILRTTQSWVQANQADWYRTLMIIQWSTWEREEWLHNDVYYQVNASGIDHVPAELQEQYRHYVMSVDWMAKTQLWHDRIWQLHEYLDSRGIAHVFFNGNNDFSAVTNRHDWGRSYIGPYDPDQTFSAILRAKGHDTVAPNSYHFGKRAHSSFSQTVLQYCINNHFV